MLYLTVFSSTIKDMARPRTRFIEPGTRYGRTVVLHELEGERPRRLKLKCDCGSEHLSHFGDVWRGQVTSCGCYRAEAIKRGLHATHGLADRPEYPIWCAMKNRCHNPNDRGYYKYGGRGIFVADEWRECFETFFSDMGSRPSPRHTLERIDNDGPYAPWNCRWATYTEQARNKRNARRYTYQGESLTAAEWSERLGLPQQALTARLEKGWDIERAIQTPFRPFSPRKRPQARSCQNASQTE